MFEFYVESLFETLRLGIKNIKVINKIGCIFWNPYFTLCHTPYTEQLAASVSVESH